MVLRPWMPSNITLLTKKPRFFFLVRIRKAGTNAMKKKNLIPRTKNGTDQSTLQQEKTDDLKSATRRSNTTFFLLVFAV